MLTVTDRHGQRQAMGADRDTDTDMEERNGRQIQTQIHGTDKDKAIDTKTLTQTMRRTDRQS